MKDYLAEDYSYNEWPDVDLWGDIVESKVTKINESPEKRQKSVSQLKEGIFDKIADKFNGANNLSNDKYPEIKGTIRALNREEIAQQPTKQINGTWLFGYDSDKSVGLVRYMWGNVSEYNINNPLYITTEDDIAQQLGGNFVEVKSSDIQQKIDKIIEDSPSKITKLDNSAGVVCLIFEVSNANELHLEAEDEFTWNGLKCKALADNRAIILNATGLKTINPQDINVTIQAEFVNKSKVSEEKEMLSKLPGYNFSDVKYGFIPSTGTQKKYIPVHSEKEKELFGKLKINSGFEFVNAATQQTAGKAGTASTTANNGSSNTTKSADKNEKEAKKSEYIIYADNIQALKDIKSLKASKIAEALSAFKWVLLPDGNCYNTDNLDIPVGETELSNAITNKEKFAVVLLANAEVKNGNAAQLKNADTAQPGYKSILDNFATSSKCFAVKTFTTEKYKNKDSLKKTLSKFIADEIKSDEKFIANKVLKTESLHEELEIEEFEKLKGRVRDFYDALIEEYEEKIGSKDLIDATLPYFDNEDDLDYIRSCICPEEPEQNQDSEEEKVAEITEEILPKPEQQKEKIEIDSAAPKLRPAANYRPIYFTSSSQFKQDEDVTAAPLTYVQNWREVASKFASDELADEFDEVYKSMSDEVPFTRDDWMREVSFNGKVIEPEKINCVEFIFVIPNNAEKLDDCFWAAYMNYDNSWFNVAFTHNK